MCYIRVLVTYSLTPHILFILEACTLFANPNPKTPCGESPERYFTMNLVFRLALKPVWPNHIHYVVYRKRFPKCIRDVYTAALNRIETALKPGKRMLFCYSTFHQSVLLETCLYCYDWSSTHSTYVETMLTL